MLRVRKGYDVDYYLNATAEGVAAAAMAAQDARTGVRGQDAYYTDAVAAGEPAGLWHGRGAEKLGLTGKVEPEMMKALYTHGLDPRDPATADRNTWHQAERFGSAPRNYKSAEEIYAQLVEQNPDAGAEGRAELRVQAGQAARQSVSFYDLVLSASKSHTLLWVAAERAARDAAAAGDHEAAAEHARVAQVLEDALMGAHRAMLEFLAERAGYARAGHHGGGAGRWVDAHDWTSAQFLQHDSREHDPQLHVHGPTANKTVCDDGTVRALDFSLILQWKDAAGAYADRWTEAYAWQHAGVRWTTAVDGTSRQVAGIDADATNLFSKRTAAIGPATDKLIARFRAETGREPTNAERAELAERASNLTKAAKVFDGETRDGQLARWAAEYDAAFGANLADLARQAVGQAPAEGERWSERDVVARALAELEDSRQSWTRSNLMTAVARALPGHLGIGPERLEELLEGLTDQAQALVRHLNPHTGPQGLDKRYHRADGESHFVKPHAQRFATDNQILGESELIAAAARRGAPAWTVEAAEEIVAKFAAAGRELSTDQARALRGILTSGAAVEVLNAPAGTGKSFLVGTLADTWPLTGRALDQADSAGAPEGGNGPRVFGVAYGQRQADVLAEEGVTARNIRAWLDGQQRLTDGRAEGDDETFRLRHGDLLVVDEAGAASTPDLVAIWRRCEALGVKLLLVGDQKQLVAVGAGGALADIAAHGVEYQLAEVRRFTEGWEGPASLRLRDGDPTVLHEYAKHGRLVDAGSVEQAEQQAGRAWLADTLAGRDALIVVGSNAAAARLSNQLRGELVRLGRVQEKGVPLGIGPTRSEWRGSVAGVGDLVQARRNAWHLDGWTPSPGGPANGEAPINRQTYRVTATHPDGGLTVARVTGREDGAETLAEPIALPASYVRDQVTLAYACTVHAAHGRTVGAGYGVVGPGTDGPSAYVEATRGRETNVLFVITRHTDESQHTGETARTARRSAAEVLADIIRPPEVDPNRTAVAVAATAAEEARATATHVDPLVTVIGDLTAGRTQRWLDELAAAGALPEHHRLALAADDARSTLDQLLRTVELAGHDPHQALVDAVTASSLDGATSTAQVLHFRLRTAHEGRLSPQVAGYADLLPRELPEQARDGLQALAQAADERRVELGARLAQDPPQWAREALGPVPDREQDPDGRARWEQRAGWAGSYRELVDHDDPADALGAAPPAGLAEKVAVFHAAHAALDLPEVGADEERMSEGRLRARWAAWQREQELAPRYVADDLETAHEAHRRASTDATIWAARAAVESDPLVRDEIAAAARQAREQAAQAAAQVERLTVADDARAAFLMDSAVTRDKAERSRTAAGLRGINLDDHSDRVTADEWLDAHLDDQRDDEAERAVTEDDLARDDEHAAEHTEAQAIDRPDVDGDQTADVDEDQAADAEADPAEQVEPAPRRRVPHPDASTLAFDRAQDVLREVAERHQAEQVAAAHAAELESEDEQLRAELARQDAYASDAQGHSDEDTDDDVFHLDR